MKLRTEIERTPLPRPLDRGEGVLLVGSCFTDHIGQWLQESWLPVMCNPWGVLFNPASIANSLMRVIGEFEKFEGFECPKDLKEVSSPSNSSTLPLSSTYTNT